MQVICQLRVLYYLPRRNTGFLYVSTQGDAKVTRNYRRHITSVTSNFCSTLYTKASFSLIIYLWFILLPSQWCNRTCYLIGWYNYEMGRLYLNNAIGGYFLVTAEGNQEQPHTVTCSSGDSNRAVLD